MKLYTSVGPNPGMVEMFIKEKNMDIERVSVDIVKGENRESDFAQKNSLGTTPVLELDDGTMISETTAICEYLEEIQPDPVLIGSNAQERAFTRMWTRRVDLEICQPMTTGFRGSEGKPMFEPRMRLVNEAGCADLKAMAADKLQWLDKEMAGQDYICGDRFSLADIMLYCFVKFGASVGQPVPEGTANLAAWEARIDARG